MQRFDRQSEQPPLILQNEVSDAARRQMVEYMTLSSTRRGQAKQPLEGGILSSPSVTEALVRLFRGRCAFCEADDKVSGYRFRPLSEALPFVSSDIGHLYYIWLANAWENMYPICETCRPTEPAFFPVRGKRAPLPTIEELNHYIEDNTGLWRGQIQEVPLLLDPCGSSDFSQSLTIHVDGTLVGLSDSGTTTISHFNLNRPNRVLQRKNALQKYLKELIAALKVDGEDNGKVSLTDMFAFRALEFGGSWYFLLRRLALRLGAGLGVTPIVSPSRIQRVFAALWGRLDSEERVLNAVAGLADQTPKELAEKQPHDRLARHGRAYVTKLSIKNFKAIEDLTITMPMSSTASLVDGIKPVPSLLILGENAAGKSSILEAAALALCGKEAREHLGAVAIDYILDPTLLAADDIPRPKKAEVLVTLNDDSNVRMTAKDGKPIEDKASSKFEPIAVFAFGAFRHYQHKERRYSPSKYVRNLFDGSLLSNPERWLLGLNDVRFNMVVRALRDIFSIGGEFDVILREGGTCYVVTPIGEISANPLPRYRRTPLNVASSGFRSILAIACTVMQGLMDERVYGGFETLNSARGLVLIDEIEAHLHPRWKMQVLRGLRRALPGMTFIVTTHDPLCLRSMEDGEVMVMQRVARASPSVPDMIPEMVEQLVELPAVSQLRIEQLLTSDFFQLYSSDDPDMDLKMATIGDLLVRKHSETPLTAEEAALVHSFETDIASAMPIGTSEAHRVVQEAVAVYLRDRRDASEARMKSLREEAKAQIIAALQGI